MIKIYIEIISITSPIFPYIEIEAITTFIALYEYYVELNNIGKKRWSIPNFIASAMPLFISCWDINIPMVIDIGMTSLDMLKHICICLKRRVEFFRECQLSHYRSIKHKAVIHDDYFRVLNICSTHFFFCSILGCT